MKLADTLRLQNLNAYAAGSQATAPDSREADAWIKKYLDDKNKRLNDLRVLLHRKLDFGLRSYVETGASDKENEAAERGIHGGGQGSGCQGPNCGRPENGSKRVIKEVEEFGDKYKASIQLSLRDGRVRIRDLSSVEKGKGYASKLLSAVTNLADKYGVTLELTASPYGDERTRLDHNQLKEFYNRHGFLEEPG